MSQEARLRYLEQRLALVEQQLATAIRTAQRMARGARIVDAVLQGDLDPGDSAEAVVMDYNFDDEEEVESAQTITVHNRYQQSFAQGAAIEARYKPAKRRWELMQGDCDPAPQATSSGA